MAMKTEEIYKRFAELEGHKDFADIIWFPKGKVLEMFGIIEERLRDQLDKNFIRTGNRDWIGGFDEASCEALYNIQQIKSHFLEDAKNGM